MNKTDWFILALIITSSVIYVGCRKIDFFVQPYEKADNSIVTELRNWVTNKKQIVSYSYQLSGLDSLILEAQWSNTIICKVSNDKTLFYVPLNNQTIGLEFFYDNELRKIDSGNIIKTSENSLQSVHEIMNGVRTYYELVIMKSFAATKFSGKISSYSIFNSFQYDYTFSNGKIVSRGFVANKPKESTTAKVKSNGTTEIKLNAEYFCEPWGHFTEWSNGMVTLDYTYMVCTQCTTTSIDIKSGEQFVKANCSGSGNTGGDPGGPVPIINFWNNIKDTCLRKLLEATLINVHQLTYEVLMNEYPESVYTSFNYTQVNMGTSGETVTNGLTYTDIHVASNGHRSVNIVLNIDALKSSSQEFNASVIMHEALHAMIVAGGDIVASNFVHHSAMANNYIEILAADLRGLFPNLPVVDSYALAWNGISIDLPDAWNALPEPTRQQYDAIARDYWMNGPKGTRPTSCN